MAIDDTTKDVFRLMAKPIAKLPQIIINSMYKMRDAEISDIVEVLNKDGGLSAREITKHLYHKLDLGTDFRNGPARMVKGLREGMNASDAIILDALYDTISHQQIIADDIVLDIANGFHEGIDDATPGNYILAMKEIGRGCREITWGLCYSNFKLKSYTLANELITHKAGTDEEIISAYLTNYNDHKTLVRVYTAHGKTPEEIANTFRQAGVGRNRIAEGLREGARTSYKKIAEIFHNELGMDYDGVKSMLKHIECNTATRVLKQAKISNPNA
jgi:hypothetical protein